MAGQEVDEQQEHGQGHLHAQPHQQLQREAHSQQQQQQAGQQQKQQQKPAAQQQEQGQQPEQQQQHPVHMVNQQKGYAVRPQMQRSYVEHLPGARAFGAELQSSLRTLMEARLAAQLSWCSNCSGNNLEAVQPAKVLYIGTDMRLELSMPVYHCRDPGCCGVFAPIPFNVGCFPVTPKVCWDVSQVSLAHPAHWFDLLLLQLCDSVIIGSGKSVAVYSLAAAMHRNHEPNGFIAPLAFEHFKRQLDEVIMVRALHCASNPTVDCFQERSLPCIGGLSACNVWATTWMTSAERERCPRRAGVSSLVCQSLHFECPLSSLV